MAFAARVPLTASTRPLSSVERVADLALALEAAPAPALRSFHLAVRIGARAVAHVVAIMPDGGREVLTPDEARMLARVLDDDQAWPGAEADAKALALSACRAEGRAFAILVDRDLGRSRV